MKPFPFQKVLDWHGKNSRENLPWRNYDFDKKTLGYRVWLSEIILQQTQVSRGVEYFNKIIKAFPTIEDLAHTSYEEFFEYYKGLGYYSRARNMLKTAIIISQEYAGIFPEETVDLVSLPGVGPYTAEAIRAFAYQKNTLSFDTNLHKVFSRFYYGNRFHKLTKNEISEIQQQFGNFIKSLNQYPQQQKSLSLSGSSLSKGSQRSISGRDINNALMDFAVWQDSKSSPNLSGRRGIAQTTITLSSPSGEDMPGKKCPWGADEDYPLDDCKYFKTNGEFEPLKAKKQSSFPTKKAQIIIILNKDHKIYFSEDVDNYKPFVISPNLFPLLNREGARGWGPREFTKQHFLEKFGLEISVRPPHKKDFQDGKPYLVCYAQIQKGEHEFGEFKEVKKDQIIIHL